MIKKNRVYIKDICKAPFIDRFFYYLLNDLRLDVSDLHYMTWNPLKWSLMTIIMSVYVALIYLILIPFIGFPMIAIDAYKMPKNYESSDFNGCFQNDVWLLRDIKPE